MLGLGFVILAAMLTAGPLQAAELTLDIRDGRVTLDAKDVTIRQILTEWARVGGTLIVNLDRLPAGPVSLRLDETPERDALDIILRSAAGYMAAPRPVALPGRSIYDRILILAVSTVAPPPPRPQATPFPTQPNVFGRPATPVDVPPQDTDDEAEEEENTTGVPTAPVRPGIGQPGGIQPGLVQPGFVRPGLVQPGLVPQGSEPSGVNQPGTVTPISPTNPLRAPLEMPPPNATPGSAASPAPGNPWNVPAGATTPGMPTPISRPQTLRPSPNVARPPQPDDQ